MHCRAARTLTQDWLDEAAGSPMPAPLREHVRTCDSCLGYIKRWGRIELGLQSMRQTGPVPSLDFAVGVRAQAAELRAERHGRLKAYRRLLMVGAGVLALLLLVRFLSVVRPPAPASVSTFAVTAPGSPPSREPAVPAVAPMSAAP